MGPAAEPTAVNDPKLRVHDITRLRIVNASMIPDLIAGHPNTDIYMIGE